MSRSAQVSYTGSGDYNKYVFTFTCICKPYRRYPGSTGPLSIDQLDKQGYISRITAVGGNLLVRLSSRDLHNANSEIHNPTDDPICFSADNHQTFFEGGGGGGLARFTGH